MAPGLLPVRGRLGLLGGRKTSPRACRGPGGRVQAKACMCDALYGQSAFPLKKNYERNLQRDTRSDLRRL